MEKSPNRFSREDILVSVVCLFRHQYQVYRFRFASSRHPPRTVPDAATWSAIVPLSIESVAHGSRPVVFPDFTGGKWKKTPPLLVYGA